MHLGDPLGALETVDGSGRMLTSVSKILPAEADRCNSSTKRRTTSVVLFRPASLYGVISTVQYVPSSPSCLAICLCGGTQCEERQ